MFIKGVIGDGHFGGFCLRALNNEIFIDELIRVEDISTIYLDK